MADLELWLRNEVLLQLSANTAEEVIEQASVSVTPLLRQRAEEIAERARPATSPAVSGGGQQRPGSPVFLSLALHAERVAEVAADIAREAMFGIRSSLLKSAFLNVFDLHSAGGPLCADDRGAPGWRDAPTTDAPAALSSLSDFSYLDFLVSPCRRAEARPPRKPKRFGRTEGGLLKPHILCPSDTLQSQVQS